MGEELARVISLSPPVRYRDDVLTGEGMLPVLPALRDLLPGGGLRRGSVVTSGEWGLLALALAVGATADGAWCAVAGVPELGVRAAAEAGLDTSRLVLVADPGPGWAQVVASLLDGFDIVLLRPPERPPAQLRRKLEAAARRYGSVLVVAGDWPGALARLMVTDAQWSGIGAGHGRLRARRAQVVAAGRGSGDRPRSAWLWLPGPDGSVAADAALVAGEPGRAVFGQAVFSQAVWPGEQRMTPTPPRVLVLRCPDWLDGHARDHESADGVAARTFEPVVALVEEFCPQVEVLRPGACAIAARGPARYFGGEAELAARIAETVREGGFACQVGIADGVFAAGLAARAGPTGLLVPPGKTPEFLAAHPVGVLGLPELCELLPRLGIETLGQLAALPPAEAAGRFGTTGALASRLARGLDPRPLIPRPPAIDLSAAMEFDPPAEESEPVVFAAKALADRMHDRLAAAGFACVRVQVLVRCADGQELSRLWRHEGLLSALAVAERVRWQLDGWQSDRRQSDRQGSSRARSPGDGVRPGAGTGGITLLRLIPDQLVRATGRQLALWGDAVPSDRVARAAIRVQALLGHDRVARPVPSGGRRPAEQAILVPFGDTQVPDRPADRPWPGQIPAPAPASVYPEPLPAEVTDSRRELVTVTGRTELSGVPAWLATADAPARVITSWAGPWPISERWWDPAHALRQARFQFLTEDGKAWLAVVQDGCWLLEASYD